MKLSLSSLAVVGIAVFLPNATGHLRPIPQASLSVEDEADYHYHQVPPASNLAQFRGMEAQDRMLKKNKKKNKRNNKKNKVSKWWRWYCVHLCFTHLIVIELSKLVIIIVAEEEEVAASLGPEG